MYWVSVVRTLLDLHTAQPFLDRVMFLRVAYDAGVDDGERVAIV